MDKGFSFEDVDDLMSEEDLKELDTVSDDKIISEYKDSVDFNNLVAEAGKMLEKDKKKIDKMSKSKLWDKASTFLFDFSPICRAEVLQIMDAISEERAKQTIDTIGKGHLRLPRRLDAVLKVLDEDYRTLAIKSVPDQKKYIKQFKKHFKEYIA
jgi:hypothetical protein